MDSAKFQKDSNDFIKELVQRNDNQAGGSSFNSSNSQMQFYEQQLN
jgi:hypothetical protein